MIERLPQYFLADLPTDAPLTARIVTEACQNLRRNQERYLLNRTTAGMIRLLSELGEQWLQPGYPFRQCALELGPAATGFTAETLREGLDHFFKQLNAETLQSLLIQDLGSPQRLDGFTQTHGEIQERRYAIAHGPALIGHIAAGNLPSPALSSLVMGLLLRSAQFIKCARGQSLLPRLLAHSIYDTEPKIASCLEIAEWPGGTEDIERALFNEVDVMTATGSDQTVESVHQRVPKKVRFLGYGQRVSFSYLTGRSLAGFALKRNVQNVGADVVAWDQQGCLSPHVIFVESRGGIAPESFAELLAAELERREAQTPRGAISAEESAAIALRRSVYEIRAAHSPDTRMWTSQGSTAWTVVFENEPRFQTSCLNRFIIVKPAQDLGEILRHAEEVRTKVSTVGIGAAPEEIQELANTLARWGASRICPIGRMQLPPLTWRHDGRPALADLVKWTDWEQ